MASVIVDGLVLPVAVGGHPALDFCNTRAGWGSPAPKEYLRSPAHLALWAAERGLLDRAEVVSLSAAHPGGDVVDRAIRFRDALYDVLVGTAAASSWEAVNVEVAAAAAHARLRPAAGAAAWDLAVPDGADRLARPLHAVAWAAAGLLTTIGPPGVRACPGDGCGWVFHDPRGRRRWCSMAWCGNRAKARRHATRMRA